MMLRRAPRPTSLVLVGALAVGGTVLVATPAQAATFTPLTGAELVTAINDANTTPGADEIVLSGSGFALPADLPAITETLIITGPGADTFTLNAAGFATFVSVGPPTNVDNTAFTLSGITIENAAGTAVDTDSIDVVLSDVVVDSEIEHTFGDFSASDVDVLESASGRGFDLQLQGTDTAGLARVTVTDTSIDGIEIDATDDSVVTLTDVTVTQSAVSTGQGAYIDLNGNADVTVVNSEFSDNFRDGLLVWAKDSSVVLIDGVTADRNRFEGIDVDVDGDSTATIRNSSASSNGDNGFESANGDGAAVVYENLTAEGNDVYGFRIEADDDSIATLGDLTAVGNGSDGMLLEPDGVATEITMTGGVAENNGGAGLYLDIDQGTATSTGLTSIGNDQSGVRIGGYDGQATLREARISGNNETLRSGSGGIDIASADFEFQEPLTILVENSTISGNFGEDVGDGGGGIGGVLIWGASLTVLNSTISGNVADQGGGIDLDGDSESELTIAHSTITLNESDDTDAGGVSVSGLSVTITHSILADNLAAAAASDLVESDSTLDIDYSLVEVADTISAAALTAGTGNIVGQPAGLGPLADNGGPTETHLPLEGSPALGAGNPSIVGAPATDQRGDDRVDGVIEIGSVEIQSPELAATGVDESLAGIAAGLALFLVLGGSALMVVRRRLG